jgi:hypothetical protein
LSCIKVRKLEVNFRHDRLNQIGHAVFRRLGLPSLLEPQSIDGSQRRADDTVIDSQGQALRLDWTIVQPTCPTWLQQGSDKEPLAAAEKAAKQKHRQGDSEAKAEDAQFIALAGEVSGAWSSEAQAAFKRLTQSDDESSSLSNQQAYIHLISALAIAIQDGNHRIVTRVHGMTRQAGLAAPVQRQLNFSFEESPKPLSAHSRDAAHQFLSGLSQAPAREVVDLSESTEPTPVHTPVHSPAHTPVHSPAHTPVHTPPSAAQQPAISASAVQLQSDGFGTVDSQGTPLQQQEPEFNPDDVILDGSVLLPAQPAQSVQVRVPASPSAGFGDLDQSTDDQQLVFPEQDSTAESDSDSDYLPEQSEVRSSRNLIGREPTRRSARGQARRPAVNGQ